MNQSGLILRLAGLLLLCVSFTACITPGEKRVMKDDIYSVQMRLLNLERLLADTSKDAKSTGDSATKRIASTQAELERMSRELQMIRGEIDALRVGVLTGQLPGADPSSQEHSVAKNLTKLSDRVAAVESAQEDLIEVLKKAGVKSGKKKTVARQSLTSASFSAPSKRSATNKSSKTVRTSVSRRTLKKTSNSSTL